MCQLSRILILIVLSCVSQAAYAKRGPAPVVPPLAVNGVTYSASPQPEWATTVCGTVYVRAVDLKTGRPLWQTKLYEIKLNPHVEGDVQDVCVESMRAVHGHLKLVNEKGDTFKVDLATGRVLEGGGRVYYDDSDIDPSQHAYLPTMLCSIAVLVTLCVLLSRYYRTLKIEDG